MNKNDAKAVEDSVEHWKRMIKWVSKQPKHGKVSVFKMRRAIDESWGSSDCALCQTRNLCNLCPLYKKYSTCGVWFYVASSKTWEDWLTHAKKLLRQLKSLSGV